MKKTFDDVLQDTIGEAIESGVDMNEIMFELAKFLALLAYANGNTKQGMFDAMEGLFDAIYARAGKMEDSGAFRTN